MLNPGRAALVFAVMLCVTMLESRPSPQDDSRPNIVLITIDTLRADYLGCYGNTRISTPTLDGLASDGALFERAYCQVPMTPPSHASILTGTYPQTHGVRDFTSMGLRPGFPTLAGILKKNGYSTAAFVSAYVLDSVWGLNQGFDLYYDHFTPREFQGANPGNVQRKAGETIDRVLAWLKGGVHRPYFLWVHLYDPHHDYNPPEPYHTRYSKDLYGGEVAYVDHELGRLIEALKRAGEYEGSLILAVSDHGEGLGEHDEYEHGFFLYEVTTHIPFIVKLPRNLGRPIQRVRQIVEAVDLAPTVLQVIRASSDKQLPMQGKGRLGEILGKSSGGSSMAYSETFYPLRNFGWSDLAAYTEGNLRFIEAPKPELYDLSLDPGESNNLYAKQQAMAQSLRERLRQFRPRMAVDPVSSVGSVDSQKVDALRSLGYFAISVPAEKRAGTTALVDPKDRIREFNRILLALQASDAGALSKSNTFLDEVVLQDPDLFIAHYSLGVNSLKAGDNKKALEHFERARVLNPSFDLTEMNRATALARLGRVDEAIVVLQEILKQTPPRLEAQKQLALLYSRKRDFGRAIEIYQKILTDRPQDAQTAKFMGVALVESENYEKGGEMLRRAMSLGADDAMVQNFLGISLANLGRTQEAISAYTKALEIKDDYQQARLNLCFALLKAGQGEQAVKEFETLCRQNGSMCASYRRQFDAELQKSKNSP